MADRGAFRHAASLDIPRPRAAKAHVSFGDIPVIDPWALRLGCALREAIRRIGWTEKYTAGRIGIDRAELGKWISGQRDLKLKRIFAVDELREPFAIALGRLADFEVVTELRKRRAVAS